MNDTNNTIRNINELFVIKIHNLKEEKLWL